MYYVLFVIYLSPFLYAGRSEMCFLQKGEHTSNTYSLTRFFLKAIFNMINGKTTPITCKRKRQLINVPWDLKRMFKESNYNYKLNDKKPWEGVRDRKRKREAEEREEGIKIRRNKKIYEKNKIHRKKNSPTLSLPPSLHPSLSSPPSSLLPSPSSPPPFPIPARLLDPLQSSRCRADVDAGLLSISQAQVFRHSVKANRGEAGSSIQRDQVSQARVWSYFDLNCECELHGNEFGEGGRVVLLFLLFFSGSCLCSFIELFHRSICEVSLSAVPVCIPTSLFIYAQMWLSCKQLLWHLLRWTPLLVCIKS